MRVCGGGGGCCCRAVVRAVSAPRSGVTVGSSAVGLMVTAGLCWTVAGGSISASPLLIVVVVVVVGSPPARLCRQPCSVVAGWLWGLCRSHCYCGAASAPLSSPRQAALPHGFLLAPPMFTYDQPGGRSLLHKGQSPPRTPLPLPPHSRGVGSRGTRRHHPPSGHQTLTILPQKQHSPNSHSWALCPMAASSMGTPTSPNPPSDTQGEENQEKQHPCAVVIHARLSPTGPNSHLGAQQSSLCPGKKGFRRWKTPLTHSSPRERLYPIRGKGEMRPLSAPGGPDPSSGHGGGGFSPFVGLILCTVQGVRCPHTSP